MQNFSEVMCRYWELFHSFPNRLIHLAARLIRSVRAVRLPSLPQRGLSSPKAPRGLIRNFMVLKENKALLSLLMHLQNRKCLAAQRGLILTKRRTRWLIDCLQMWIQKFSVSCPETSSRSCYQALSPAPLWALLAMSVSHSLHIQWQISMASLLHQRANSSLLTGTPQETSRAPRVRALCQDKVRTCRFHSFLTALFREMWTPKCFRSCRRMFKESCFPTGSSRSWSWRAPHPGNWEKASRVKTKKLQEKTAKQTICSSILNRVKKKRYCWKKKDLTYVIVALSLWKIDGVLKKDSFTCSWSTLFKNQLEISCTNFI